MKTNIFVIGFAAFITFMISCTSTKTNSGDNSKSDNSKNSLDWSGVYTGILPCADCNGIQTTIKLNKDLTYELETFYLDKSTDILKSDGTFSWNQSGTVITLNDVEKNIIPSYYAVGENKLTQLDLKGNYITGKLSDKYILHKEVSMITEKYWKLIEINGKAIIPSDSWKKEPHMILKSTDNKINGNGGCNSFFGNYQLMEGNRIPFSKIGSTEMYCQDMDIEKQFFQGLEKADNYTMKNDTLSLNKARMATLAKFVAVYLK
jgi:copper homeostasis protein (lipoprotein)